MKAMIFAAVVASPLLSVCTGEASPLKGWSPEEVAAYLAFGFENKAERDANGVKINVEKLKNHPFTLVATVRGPIGNVEVVLETTTQDGCKFTFSKHVRRGLEVVGEEQRLLWDFTQLQSTKVFDAETPDAFRAHQAQFEGVEIEVIKGSRNEWRVGQDKWTGRLRLNDSDNQSRINEAVSYFRTHICPPK